MKRTFAVTVFMFILFSLFSETIHIASLDSLPYVSASLPDFGPHAVLIRRAFEVVGENVDLQLYPWAIALPRLWKV